MNPRGSPKEKEKKRRIANLAREGGMRAGLRLFIKGVEGKPTKSQVLGVRAGLASGQGSDLARG